MGSLADTEAFSTQVTEFSSCHSVLARPRSTIKSSNSDIGHSEQKTREFYILLGHILFTVAGSGGQSPRELGKHDVCTKHVLVYSSEQRCG